MDAERDDLLDPDFIARLRVLALMVRRRRRQRKQGPVQTPAAGHTREFKDRRHYSRGDDFRTIDWRAFARLDRMFVRVFEEVQEYHVHLIIDRSTSMAEPHPAKRREALRLAMALGYMALTGGHRLSLHTIGGGCRRELPPLKGPGHVHGLAAKLRSLAFSGSGELGADLARFAGGGDRRGLVFLISDCLGRSPGEALPALRQMRAWPAEAHVLHVVDPAEVAPTQDGELRLECVESGAVQRLWLTRDDLAHYRAAFGAWRDELARACAGWEIDHMPWHTDRPFAEQFTIWLERGCALAGA